MAQIRIVEVDENTKVPLRMIWAVVIGVAPIIFWIFSISSQSSEAAAGIIVNRERIGAIERDRATRIEKYNDNLIEIKTQLSAIQTQMKILTQDN